MRLSARIGILIRHCEHGVRRVAQLLSQQQRQQRALQQKIDDMAEQAAALGALLSGQQLQAQMVNRAALFMQQQRQAVLRQQRYLLDFERERLLEQVAALALQQQTSTAEMHVLQRKQQKFEHWADLQRRRRMLDRLQREEMENEERVIQRLS